MIEIRTELKVYKVELQCEKCDEGTMISTGEYQAVSPLRYFHKCSNKQCDNQIVIPGGKKYPVLEYKEVGDHDYTFVED